MNWPAIHYAGAGCELRGTDSPHPFFVSDTDQRNDVVTFLRSLGTN